MDTIAFFLPTRMGSERIQNKNTKTFNNIEGGLFKIKLQQLINVKSLNEILISTNDDYCIDIAKEFKKYCNKIKIIKRPNDLCLSTTNLKDLINYVPTLTSCNHIIWGHVTTPCVDSSIYENAIYSYFKNLKNGYDSLIGVNKIKNFFLNKDGLILNNSSTSLWPRTQDLEPIYEINHSIFITSSNIYKTMQNRIGENPFLFEIDKLHSIDIDWEEDFIIAEQIYKLLF